MNTSVPPNIQIFNRTYEGKPMRWISVEHLDEASANYLKHEFHFHHLDFEDALAETHRSKITKYKQYMFMVFLFPVYNTETRQVDSGEIDFFVGPDYIVSIHKNTVPLFADLVKEYTVSPEKLDKAFDGSAQHLLYRLLQRLLAGCFSLLDEIDQELELLEDKIFNTHGKGLLEEILEVRHAIIDMRKIVKPYHAAFLKLKNPDILSSHMQHFELDDRLDDYFDNLIERTQEVWNQLESFKESIDALHETNSSLISYRTNEVIKTLTVVSVVLLPATVVSSIFGMNAQYIPFAGHVVGFEIMLGIIVFAIACTLLFIRRKNLL